VSDRKDDLRRQFGTVWRMASSGFDTLREVVVRSSQSGRLRVDLALMARERQHLLATLGEQVAALIDEGALDVPSEVKELHERLRDIEHRMRVDSARAHDNAFGAARGYEPESGNFMEDELDPDEHAAVAGEEKPKSK
jgi:hypothetical protein